MELDIRQVYEKDENGTPTRYTSLAMASTYTEASALRRANGIRLAAYHSMPIELELWERVPSVDDPDVLIWVYVNKLTTELVFTMEEGVDDHDDTYPVDDPPPLSN